MTTKVLICDDSSFARKQLARALPSEWEVEVTFASDGREGLDQILREQFDVVFLDLTMPVMDGYGVLENLDQSAKLPVIIITSADIQPGAQDRVKGLGAAGFISKPLDADSVRAALEKFGVFNR